MTITKIHVTYGKAKQYIASTLVADNAVDKYKEEMTTTLRRMGKTKEITFTEYKNFFTAWDGKGTYGLIMAYTLNGYDYNFKVK